MTASTPDKAVVGSSGAKKAHCGSKGEAVSSGRGEPEPAQPGCKPIDVVDGIPDRSSRRAAWKYILLALIFLAWIAFLLYCLLAGRINH